MCGCKCGCVELSCRWDGVVGQFWVLTCEDMDVLMHTLYME